MWAIKKRPKCRSCGRRLEGETADVRLETMDGIVTIEICGGCADLLDLQSEASRRTQEKEE